MKIFAKNQTQNFQLIPGVLVEKFATSCLAWDTLHGEEEDKARATAFPWTHLGSQPARELELQSANLFSGCTFTA